MVKCYSKNYSKQAIPIIPICQKNFSSWLKEQPKHIQNLVAMNNFSAKSGSYCLISNNRGALERVLLGINDCDDFLKFGALPLSLPQNTYKIVTKEFSSNQLENAAIGWGLGSYQYARYKKSKPISSLIIPKECSNKKIENIVSSVFWARDLINTPSADLYPEIFANEIKLMANKLNVNYKEYSGDNLKENFPAVYTVGSGSEREPYLVDLEWGKTNKFKIALVGKGVCFDSGGLCLKSAGGMGLMKKDMSGAAHAIALAQMVITANLPVHLRVIVPIVENMVSKTPMMPGDVIKTRKGLTVEVTNTDAEGRLILADSLSYACEWKPDLLIDFSSLTGAARIALGPEIAAMFTPSDTLAQDISNFAANYQEPVWRLPLYQAYCDYFKSNIADWQNNGSAAGFAGAITAALFLQQFVSKNVEWVHFDMTSYNFRSKPGKPEGGDVYCLKGLFKYISQLSDK